MVNSIDRSQNVYSNSTAPISPSQVKHAPPLSSDTLRKMAHAAPEFSFNTIWQAIVDCFRSIFSCFFKTNSGPTTTPKIAEIAARDHFIWFYKQEENALTAFLGNFHPCTIDLWGLRFSCAEAAFQAAKFAPRRDLMQQFVNLDGQAAFRLGRNLSRSWTPAQTAQWQLRNLDVMREVVTAKFAQNLDLRALLIETSDSYLVEHIPVKGRDAFWGNDFDGTGQNWLGRICMEVRGTYNGCGVRVAPPQYQRFLQRIPRV